MLVFVAVVFGPDKMTAPQLIELSRGNSARGIAEFPQRFLWLMWEAEKVTAIFRVQIYNRDHGPAN